MGADTACTGRVCPLGCELWRRWRRQHGQEHGDDRRHGRRGSGSGPRGTLGGDRGRHRDRQRRALPRLRDRAARLELRQLRCRTRAAIQHLRRHRPVRCRVRVQFGRRRMHADTCCHGVDQHGRPGHVRRRLRGDDRSDSGPLPRPHRPRGLRRAQRPPCRAVTLPPLRHPVPRRCHRCNRPVAGTAAQGDRRRIRSLPLGPAQRAVHDRHLLLTRWPQRPPLPARVGRPDQRSGLHLRPQLAG